MSEATLPAANLPKTFEATAMEAKWEASGIAKADPNTVDAQRAEQQSQHARISEALKQLAV